VRLGAIRRRLTLGYVAIVAAIVASFGAVVLVGFEQATDRDRDLVLVTKARAMAAGGATGMTGGQDTAEFGYALFGADGRPADRDATAASLGLPAPALARTAMRRGAPVLRTVPSPRGDVRIASVPVGGGRVSQVGRPLGADAAALGRLGRALVPAGLVALVLAAVGGLAMARRALRPVEAAFERQRAFVADASHELKTPLALARMDAEVLQREPTAADAPELLAHQVAEIDRMGALLSDLLLLARLDAGELRLADERFDLAAVLTDSLRRFETRAAAKGVELAVAAAGPLPARGDARRTEQAIAVLLDNAVRLTPAGGYVMASARADGGRMVAEVADTGPGLADRERVFDRFHQGRRPAAEATPTAPTSGLGLGIARSLVRAQGGELVAVEGAGPGATFRLTLPADGRGPGPSAPVQRARAATLS